MKKFKTSKFFKKKKKIQNFQFLRKIQVFYQKKKSINQSFQLLEKNSRFLHFSKKKKNQNFQFHEKIKDFQIFQKKRKMKFSKRALGLRALDSYFLGCFKKKKKITNKNFQFLEKIQDFQI